MATILFALARPNARTMRIIAPRGARGAIDGVEMTVTAAVVVMVAVVVVVVVMVVVVVVAVANWRENLEGIIRRARAVISGTHRKNLHEVRRGFGAFVSRLPSCALSFSLSAPHRWRLIEFTS